MTALFYFGVVFMFLHCIAFVICFIGLIILSAMGEEGALRQLMFFLASMVVAGLVALATFALFIGF